jgi:hypothetical protein
MRVFGVAMRRVAVAIVGCFVTVVAAHPTAAEALPALGEVYIGGGAHTVGGLPLVTKDDVSYRGCFEAGIDDIGFLRDWGGGVRAQWLAGRPQWSAEVRYQITAIPTTRLLAIANFSLEEAGRGGAVLATRTLLGLPYVGTQVGLYRDSNGDWSPAATLTIGIAL